MSSVDNTIYEPFNKMMIVTEIQLVSHFADDVGIANFSVVRNLPPFLIFIGLSSV